MAAAIAAATLAAQRIRSNQGPVGSQAFQQLSNENQRGSTISDSLLAGLFI